LKIHILHKIREGPWGGGNQFLKSLREVFRSRGIYEERPEKADAILFNSHQALEKAFDIKKANPAVLFVHRVDGPVSPIRDSNRVIDETIFRVNQALADGTVFQSVWSMEKNRDMGMPSNRFETVVLNAPDPGIFNRTGKAPFEPGRKTRLVNTSWSPNMNKGFDVYQWLDEHLDFARYEMTFIGRSPFAFKNIRSLNPLPSMGLARELKKHDIFITASRNDPCSNSLIEALHCGLPALGFRDGGHPEIIGRGGELFDRPEEIPGLLERMRSRYPELQAAVHAPGLEQVSAAYEAFIKRIYRAREEGLYTPKRLGPGKWVRGRAFLLKWGILRKMENLGSLLRGRPRQVSG